MRTNGDAHMRLFEIEDADERMEVEIRAAEIAQGEGRNTVHLDDVVNAIDELDIQAGRYPDADEEDLDDFDEEDPDVLSDEWYEDEEDDWMDLSHYGETEGEMP